MLVQFSVKNHRAVRKKQTFSMIAGDLKRPARPRHVADTGSPVVPRVLRSACLFGANGAGKTSLITAMGFMSWFVRTSFRQEPGEAIPITPFLFNPKWRNSPSEFEVYFLHNENLYQYGFVISKDRVLDEWLYAWSNATGRQRNIFTRRFNRRKQYYDWDVDERNVKGKRKNWQESTRKNSLFLSAAAGMNATGSIMDAYSWTASFFRTVSNSREMPYLEFTDILLEDPSMKKPVHDLLWKSGVALNDISVEKKKKFETKDFLNLPKRDQELLKKNIENDEVNEIEFIRKDSAGDFVSLSLEEESYGTRALFDLAGPILHTLGSGFTLVVDEFNLGLHPTTVRSLIALFCNSKINVKNAQLIFTTHDPTIVDQAYFARDQVWLLEKSEKDLSTNLVHFSDFDEDDRSFSDGYLQGRYGTLPHVRRKL